MLPFPHSGSSSHLLCHQKCSPTHLLHSCQLGNLTSHKTVNMPPPLHCNLLTTITSNHLLFGKTAKQQISDGGQAQALHPPSCPPSSHFQGSGTVKRWFRRRSRRRSGCCERVLQLQLSSWQLLPASLLPPACLAWPALGPSVCHGAQQLVRPLTQLRSTQPRHF